jgi:hypothetical protein
MNNYYVYLHIREDTHSVFYVGKGKGSRAYYFDKRGHYYKNVRNKLRRMGFQIIVQFIGTNLSERESFDLEIATIAKLKDQGIRLVNQTNGGEGASGRTGKRHPLFGKPISDYHRQRLREVFKDRQFSEETRKKIGVTKIGNTFFRGKHHTEEAKAKISYSQKGERAYWFGRTLSEETRRKMSAAMKGRIFTEEHKAKIKAAWVKRKQRGSQDEHV